MSTSPPRSDSTCHRCGARFQPMPGSSVDACAACLLDVALSSGSSAAFNSSQFEHYRILTRPDGSPVELGRGSMGVTYKAFDERLQIEIALKVIKPAWGDDPAAQALFVREARAAARIRHPNVASVLFLNGDPEHFFYAMEFVAGESLRDWTLQRGTVPPELVVELGIQLARGLGAIHDEHIVHRDLKPSNVMVFPSRASSHASQGVDEADAWQLKIIDFGLARVLDAAASGNANLQATQGFKGTALYASPEQCQEESDIDGRVDLYSLGCILWEMLCGKPPFVGRSYLETLNMQATAKLPVERISGLPTSLQEVLVRLLAKDREKRFPDADAVVKALERCRQDISNGTRSQWATALASAGPDSSHPTAVPIQVSVGESRNKPRLNRRVLFGALAVIAIAASVLTAGLSQGWWRKTLPVAEKTAPVTAVAPLVASVPTPGPFVGAKPATPTPIPEKSVAVLLFENLSEEKDKAFFADGLQDDVLSSLAKIKDIKIVARSSLPAYSGALASGKLREAGQALGVAYVLQGRVRRSGDRVLLTVQLVDTRDDRQVWAERYDRTLADSLTLQGELAQEIARALKATLTAEEKTQLSEAPTKDAIAYELYLQAMELLYPKNVAFLTAGSVDTNARAYELLSEATKRDPSFLAAHSLSGSVSSLAFLGTKKPEWRERAEASIAAAVQLQPEAGETLLAQGNYFSYVLRQKTEARTKFLEASKKLPNYWRVFLLTGQLDYEQGRWDDAMANYRRTIELDPENVRVLSIMVDHYSFLHRWPEVVDVCTRATAFTIPPRRWEFELWRDGVEVDRAANLQPIKARQETILSVDPEFLTKPDNFLMWKHAWDLAVLERDSAKLERLMSIMPKFYARRRIELLLALTSIRDGSAAAAQVALTEIPGLEEEVRKDPDNFGLRLDLATVCAVANRKDDAIREMERAREVAQRANVPISQIWLDGRAAQIYATLGEKMKAIEILEPLSLGPSLVSYGDLVLSYQFDPLRAEPRFQALLAKLRPAGAAK